MAITIDFRLNKASLELEVLEVYLDLIENQISRSVEDAENERPSQMFDDEAEWHLFHQMLDWKVTFVIPRVLRNSFLFSLFVVYETIVTDVANHLQKRMPVERSIDDIKKRNFLKRAKKYYKKDLGFDLSTCNERWKRLRVLSSLRNSIAHSHGRIDMTKSNIDEILRTNGVKNIDGFIVVNSAFLRETFELVKADLEDLIVRYKAWDSDRTTP